MTKTTGKYVLLRGRSEGNRFFTEYKAGIDPTLVEDGTVAYAVIDYADTIAEAQIKLYGKSYTDSKE